MVKITNHTRGTMDFIVGVKDGAAVTDHVLGGETKDIALLNPNDATVLGRVVAGAITVEGGSSSGPAKRHAPAAAPERRTASTLAGDAPVRD